MQLASSKRPLVAALLAMLSPGLGHVYLREWLRGLLWFGLVFSTVLLVVTPPTLEAATVDALVGAYVAAAESVTLLDRLVLATVSSLSVADAYWLAARERHRETGARCPACGKELTGDLTFCQWCAEEVAPPEAGPPEAEPTDSEEPTSR